MTLGLPVGAVMAHKKRHAELIDIVSRILPRMTSNPSTYAIPLTRLLARLEQSLGDSGKLASLNEVELRKAAAVAPHSYQLR